MPLEEYKKKRDFKKTKEPKAKKKSSKKQLLFIIQKHNARRLHYDFRLEMEGVLKSWAVPKGPSLNPKDKRLAMMVEDHPYDYKDFEGVIPKGEYGAGEVIIWDNGVYAPVGGSEDKKENEKILLKALAKGELKFLLAGHKINGEFALVRINKDENSWLLIKKKDDYSTDKDVLKKDKSIISGNTIEDIAAESADEDEDKPRSKKKKK